MHADRPENGELSTEPKLCPQICPQTTSTGDGRHCRTCSTASDVVVGRRTQCERVSSASSRCTAVHLGAAVGIVATRTTCSPTLVGSPHVTDTTVPFAAPERTTASPPSPLHATTRAIEPAKLGRRCRHRAMTGIKTAAVVAPIATMSASPTSPAWCTTRTKVGTVRKGRQ